MLYVSNRRWDAGESRGRDVEWTRGPVARSLGAGRNIGMHWR